MNIIDQIDAVTSCQQCGNQLDASPSTDFCSETCQAHWHAERVDITPEPPPPRLPDSIFNHSRDALIYMLTAPLALHPNCRPAREPATLDDIIEMVNDNDLPVPPEPIEVTRAQWEELKAACPPAPDYGIQTNAIGSLTGVPIVIVEPAEEMGPPRIRDRVACAWQVLRDAVQRAFGRGRP